MKEDSLDELRKQQRRERFKELEIWGQKDKEGKKKIGKKLCKKNKVGKVTYGFIIKWKKEMKGGLPKALYWSASAVYLSDNTLTGINT